MEKSAAAKHSADYRARQAEAKAKLGIEQMSVEVAAGTRSQMDLAMKAHGYSQVQELWQDLALSFLSMPHEEQARRLRKPGASVFVITHKLTRQFEKESRRAIATDCGDDVIEPYPRLGEC